MARSWKDVKADKADRDRAAGRDMALAREDARTRTQAYLVGSTSARSDRAGSGDGEIDRTSTATA